MIVGLVGFAGSGKGTVADVLVDKHDFTKLSFADGVKDCVSTIFGWPRHLLEGDNEPSRAFREKRDAFWSAKLGIEVTPRWALQTMGTEAGRNVFHKDLWVFSLEKKLSEHKNVVIADVRFPNEIDFIKDNGGFVVRVVRGNEPIWYETAFLTNTTPDDEQWMHYDNGRLMENKYPEIHVSEWAWIGSPFHYQIYNNGTKTELEGNVKYMLTCFAGPGRVKSVA